MKILIAEDERVSRRLLELTLIGWGHEVIVTERGEEAWAILEQEDSPSLAILDWMMPGMDGIEICRRVRQRQTSSQTYLILLTAKSSKANVVEGLIAGANDYVTKPFDRDELRARLKVGETVLDLQQKLAGSLIELADTRGEVRVLQGILPICSYGKHVRDDKDYWQSVECYLSEHSEAEFSHSICPACYVTMINPQLGETRSKRLSAA